MTNAEVHTRASAYTAACVLLALLACKGAPSGSADAAEPKASAASASSAAPDAGPTAPFAKSGYQLRFGPAASATDPKPTDFSDKMKTGFVALRFETDAEDFGLSKLRVSLYRVRGTKRTIETQRVSTIDPEMNLYHKSWEIGEAGRYEVKIEDPEKDEVLAIKQFQVEE